MELHFTGSLDEFESLIGRTAVERPADLLAALDDLKATIMATAADVKVSLAKLNDDTNKLGAAITRVWDYVTAQGVAKDAKIAELQAKVAAGEAITAQDLQDFTDINDGITAADAPIQAIVAQLEAIGATPADPLPVADPIPDVPA